MIGSSTLPSATSGSSVHVNLWIVFSPAECDGWSAADQSPLSSPAQRLSSTEAEEEAASEQRSVTETVINGSMKETLSLTVDAKTETAVFKRLDQCTKRHFKVLSCIHTQVDSCGLKGPKTSR